MKILNVHVNQGNDFRTDQTTVTFKDWGIELYAQEIHNGELLPTHKKLYIPWTNIKFLEEISV